MGCGNSFIARVSRVFFLIRTNTFGKSITPVHMSLILEIQVLPQLSPVKFNNFEKRRPIIDKLVDFMDTSPANVVIFIASS